ncbi:hypothetical protein KY289_000833 [Solanum tuberosum]|nr:hypothetical protein KY289_000833 [Solanum tuberosum]
MGDTCRKEPHEYDDQVLKNQDEMKDTSTTQASQKFEMELVLMSELASVKYHEPLQITGVSDGEVIENIQDDQKPVELEINKVESTLAPIIAGKSVPMDSLHELISHKCLNKDPVIIEKEFIISEKSIDVEDNEEEENDTNLHNISKEAGLSPKMYSRVRKGKGK